jgi:hypothetical protein
MEQAREEPPMSLDDIRARAQRFQAKLRRRRILTISLVGILVVANIVTAFWPGEHIVERTGDLLTVAAFVYIWFEYRKHLRAASRPERLGLTNSVDFYRAQLVDERNLSRQSRRYLLPFVPGVTLSLLGNVFDGRPMSRLIGVAVFGVALFLGVAWWNAYTARRLQQQIDALDAL